MHRHQQWLKSGDGKKTNLHSMDILLFGWIMYTWIQLWTWARLAQGLLTGPVAHLSRKEVFLLEEEENPKCFTRTLKDFTCFWEVSNNKSYEFFYKHEDLLNISKTCDLTLEDVERNRTFHTCYIPTSDVFLYTTMYIRVVENSTGQAVYIHNVSVERHVLLEPPENISLYVTGEPGQLHVTWSIPVKWKRKTHYEIRHSSEHWSKRTELVKDSSQAYTLHTVQPGEVCHVQLRAKLDGYSMSGHWSDWSQPSSAMVPQRAEDINLRCHTSDMRNIQCLWTIQSLREDSVNQYTLFYKLSASGSVWQECTQQQIQGQCIFSAEKSSSIRVYLRSGPGPHDRTFYSEQFSVPSSIKTDPPRLVKWVPEGNSLHVQWEPPLWNFSNHLMYQIRYSPQGESVWKEVTLQSSKTSTRLDVQAGTQYLLQVKAKPNGSIYNGFWSEWSDTLIVNLPSNIGVVFIIAILVILLMVGAFLIISFPKHISKIKQHLWPPVPNLEKVLEGFLTEMDRQCENHMFIIKQCYDDIPASVVEIVQEGELSVCGKTREQVFHLLPNPGLEHTVPSDTCLDYVTLNSENPNLCFRRNEYVPGDRRVPGAGVQMWQAGRLCSCSHRGHFFDSSVDVLNRSYLLLTDQTEDPSGGDAEGLVSRYTNLPTAAE